MEKHKKNRLGAYNKGTDGLEQVGCNFDKDMHELKKSNPLYRKKFKK